MSIAALKKIVPAPETPVHAEDSGKWRAAQKAVQIALPPDYLEVAKTYGSGQFCDQRWIELDFINPLDPIYQKWALGICDRFRKIKTISDEGTIPYGIHPESPGLLPWGTDPNGHALFWLTEGEPADWPIILSADGGQEFERIDLTPTQFLADVFSRRLKCMLWPKFKRTRGKVNFVPSKSG